MKETIFKLKKGLSHKITMIPRRKTLSDGGVVVENRDAKTIEFRNGEYRTSDKAEIDYIRSRKMIHDNFTEITPKDQEAIERRIKIDKKAREIAEKEVAEEEARAKKK